MKKILICLLGILVFSGCDKKDNSGLQQCDGFEVQMAFANNGEVLRANINGDDVELSLVQSASGAKYAGILNDTVVVLWEKADKWSLVLDDDRFIDCKAK